MYKCHARVTLFCKALPKPDLQKFSAAPGEHRPGEACCAQRLASREASMTLTCLQDSRTRRESRDTKTTCEALHVRETRRQQLEPAGQLSRQNAIHASKRPPPAGLLQNALVSCCHAPWGRAAAWRRRPQTAALQRRAQRPRPSPRTPTRAHHSSPPGPLPDSP